MPLKHLSIYHTATKMCVAIIVIAAFITIGFVAAERNIIPSPAVCATFPNEEFAIDEERCQNTCAFYGRTWDCHSNYYKPKGDCYCKSGFARLTKDGNCVSVTTNAACKAKLPITPEKCQAYEHFVDYVEENNANSCLKYGYTDFTTTAYWGPHCVCKDEHYRRLSNGSCVHISHPQCVAEYQPSARRCSAIGQIYATNAPCQPACNGELYCPPAAGACICPPGLIVQHFSVYYSKADGNGQQVTYEVPMIYCNGNC